VWSDPGFLRHVQYGTDANLRARQSMYAYQHPYFDLTARVIDLADVAPDATVADIGCGNGYYLAELARRDHRGRLLGVDMSTGMLAAARTRAPRATLLAGDAAALPLPDGFADRTMANHMLYHVPDRDRALTELRRITRPGGQVIVVLNGADHLHELRAAIDAALRGLGHTLTRHDRITLDDAEPMLRHLFADVTRHDFISTLHIPGPDPIAEYVRSMSVAKHSADPDLLAAAVLAQLPNDGRRVFTATTHSGALICGPR
jgi:ubiquinone/menaquinone biosynthesis C-methylase UbiE